MGVGSVGSQGEHRVDLRVFSFGACPGHSSGVGGSSCLSLSAGHAEMW